MIRKLFWSLIFIMVALVIYVILYKPEYVIIGMPKQFYEQCTDATNPSCTLNPDGTHNKNYMPSDSNRPYLDTIPQDQPALQQAWPFGGK